MRIILIRKHNIHLAQNNILYITYHSMMLLWPHTPQVKRESLSYPCWFGFVFISFVCWFGLHINFENGIVSTGRKETRKGVKQLQTVSVSYHFCAIYPISLSPTETYSSDPLLSCLESVCLLQWSNMSLY